MSEKITFDKDKFFDVLSILSIPLFIVGWAFVLQSYFTWFFAPSFGVAVPSLAMCCGLHFAVRVLVYQRTESNESKAAQFESSVAKLIAGYGVGWIIHLFV